MARIPDDSDRVLFEEASKSYSVRAFRATYILVWISCAESIKRRFVALAQHDSVAGLVVGKISNAESAQKSVDMMLLKEANAYGLISDVEFARLESIYKMRCVFGHPYDIAPTDVQINEAAEAVAEAILTKTLRLRHGYLKQRLQLLVKDDTYIDNTKSAIKNYADELAKRTDPELTEWFLLQLWSEAETLVLDPSFKWLRTRITLFSRCYLETVKVEDLKSWDVHAHLVSYPNVVCDVFCAPSLFSTVSGSAQDKILGLLLRKAVTHPWAITVLQALYDDGVLSKRQKQRFSDTMLTVPIEILGRSQFPLVDIVDRIIAGLKIRDWDKQNFAIDALSTRPPEQIKELAQSTQRDLGRNILQAAHGGSWNAKSYVSRIAESEQKWPPELIAGLVLECFVNERGEVRFKTTALKQALISLVALPPKSRGRILQELTEQLEVDQFSHGSINETYKIVESLREERDGFLEPLLSALHGLKKKTL